MGHVATLGTRRRRRPACAAGCALAVLITWLPGGPGRAQESGEEPPPAPADPSAAPDEDAGPAPAPPDTRLTDEQRFEQGQTLFEFGDCESVIRVLGDFALGGAGRDEEQLVEAHRMLGVCYFQLGRRPEAERELKQLLYLNPDYELDPFLTPPPVVQLFDELKVELKEKLEEIRRARQERVDQQNGDAEPVTVVVEREVAVQQTPWLAAFLPFGGGQYVNGEPAKAVAFAAAQIGAIFFHGALFGLLQLVHPDGLIIGDAPWRLGMDPETDPQLPLLAQRPVIDLQNDEIQQSVATILWGAQFLTLAASLAVYGGGVTDALLSREEEVVTDESTRTLPPGEAPPGGGETGATPGGPAATGYGAPDAVGLFGE